MMLNHIILLHMMTKNKDILINKDKNQIKEYYKQTKEEKTYYPLYIHMNK